jgi:hypothetical protein
LQSPSSIRIPGNVREIGENAFSDLTSVIDLSFEEGTVRIGVSAFSECFQLKNAAFPASLIAIDTHSFQGCSGLCRITFAAGSQLQYIRSKAFSDCPLREVVIPATIVEIDPSAFSNEVWQSSLTFGGPPLILIGDHVILSLDSTVLFRSLSPETGSLIASSIEVMGTSAFQDCQVSTVLFESGAKLGEIGSRAFAGCLRLGEFSVRESVEIIGAHCFDGCSLLDTIEFEGSSRLKMIGEHAFVGCNLHSITIPALIEEIDGSAFVNCPCIWIQVAPGSLHFNVERSLLVTSDGTEIVRYFGLDRESFVGKQVRFLRKSYFAGCKHVDRVDFEIGSELERIDCAALRDCVSLIEIDFPRSVEIIGEASFERCTELDSCLIDQDSSLVMIGVRAFANCTSLRSFSIPQQVGEIGSNCFKKCNYLYRLKFQSLGSLAKVIRNQSLDEALDGFGVTVSSTLFRIELEDEGVKFKFPWSYVCDSEGDLQLSLVGDIQ